MFLSGFWPKTRDSGYNAAVYDMNMDDSSREEHDMLSTQGFILAVQLAKRLVPGGCLMAGVPCTTWIWMSRHSTGRNIHPEGSIYADGTQVSSWNRQKG